MDWCSVYLTSQALTKYIYLSPPLIFPTISTELGQKTARCESLRVLLHYVEWDRFVTLNGAQAEWGLRYRIYLSPCSCTLLYVCSLVLAHVLCSWVAQFQVSWKEKLLALLCHLENELRNLNSIMTCPLFDKFEDTKKVNQTMQWPNEKNK